MLLWLEIKLKILDIALVYNQIKTLIADLGVFKFHCSAPIHGF